MCYDIYGVRVRCSWLVRGGRNSPGIKHQPSKGTLYKIRIKIKIPILSSKLKPKL